MKLAKPTKQSVKAFFQKPLAQVFVIAAALELLVDSFSRESFFRALGAVFTDPLIFLYNTLIIAITLMPALFFARRTFFYVVIALLWIIIGVTDFILLQFRTTPFTFVDVTMIKSAINIWDHYLTVWQLVLIAVLLAAAVVGCAFLFRRVKKQEKLPALRTIKSIIIMAACFIIATDAGVYVKVLSKNFGNLADAYHSYGLPYCFMSSVFNTGIAKPKKYSDEYVQEIIEAIENGTLVTSADAGNTPSADDGSQTANGPDAAPPDNAASADSQTPAPTQAPDPAEALPAQPDEPEHSDTPNILFLQLESFFDPTSIVGSTFTDDPLPNYRRLMQEYTSGYLYVPSVGAGTANTEFEVITGMNLDFFGPGEYPYKTILLETTCESIGYVLKNHGYGTHAIHNNDGTFYGRHLVFPNLGFDSFTSIEYMNNIERTPLNWAKDEVLIEEITKALDSTEEPDFVYTISVQGHGSYPSEPVLDDPAIGLTLPEHLSDLYYPLLYYTNQIHEMDTFVAGLIAALESRDEDTVLVMYGDHLPGFKLTEEDLGGTSLFATQYIVWSSFDMEAEHRDLEAYQLYSYVLDRLDIHDGIINGFHQTQKDCELYLEELEILEYDMLYGDQSCYNGENPYAPTDMQMGIDPIILTGIRAFDGSAGSESITDLALMPETGSVPDGADPNDGKSPDSGIASGSGTEPENEAPSAAGTAASDKTPSGADTADTSSAEDEEKEKDDGGFWSIFTKKDKENARYTMFFLGSGFTPYSYVQVDGEEVNTMYVSDTVLTAVMPLPEAGAKITIVQHGPDEQVLSSSEPLIVTEQLLKNIFPRENPELEGED